MQTTETNSLQQWKRVLVIFMSCLIIAGIAIAVFLIFPGEKMMFAGKRPTNLGVNAGQLAACPSTPNCVSSFSTDATHQIEPLTYKVTPAEAMTRLKQVIQSQERTQLISATNTYLYAEFKSALMGFVDDVEFLLDDQAKVIHVRSASRLGESDLGVNRKRIETIRREFNRS